MKILYVNDVLFSGSSGELTHTVGILNALASNEVEITYLTLQENVEILKRSGLIEKVHLETCLFKGNSKLKRLRYYFRLFVLRKQEFTIIYARESFFSFLLWPIAFSHAKKLVLEYNGLRSVEVNKTIFQLLINVFGYFNKQLAKRIKKNVAVAAGIESYLIKHWGLSNTITINNGSDLTRPKDVLKSQSLLKKLVFVGNIAYWQNFDYLLCLISKNQDFLRKNHVVFEFYGDGKELSRLVEKIAELKISDLAIFKGVVLKSDLPEVLSGARAGILIDTRFIDGKPLFSPLKMYEYNLFNLPTIFFTEEQYPNLQDHGFFLINGENIQDLPFLISEKFMLDSRSRSWDDVSQEFFELVF